MLSTIRSTQETRSWVWVFSIGICYTVLVALAFSWTHSMSGWLVIGLGPVLLVDRFVFRLISPPDREPREAQLLFRVAYLIIGAAGFYLVMEGAITIREALLLGMVMSLSTFIFEFVLEWGAWLTQRVFGRHPSSSQPPVSRFVGLVVLVALPLVLVEPLIAVHPVRTPVDATPAEADMEFQELLMRTSDDVKLATWYVPADDARGTVIFCHGYRQNRGQVMSVLRLLHELRLNVLAFDFRGHGESDGHTVTFGHREVEDVKTACACAGVISPERPIYLMGVSYGASVALQALPELPEIDGVWVDSAFARFTDVVGRRLSYLPAPLRSTGLSIYNGLVWLDCGFWSTRVNPIDSVRKVRDIPIYFCHGLDDPLVPLDDAKHIYAAYRGPKGSFWMRRGGHKTIHRDVTREYHLRLRRFLEARLADGPVKPAAAG